MGFGLVNVDSRHNFPRIRFSVFSLFNRLSLGNELEKSLLDKHPKPLKQPRIDPFLFLLEEVHLGPGG